MTDSYIKKFETYLKKDLGKSANTCESYARDMRQFEEYLKAHGESAENSKEEEILIGVQPIDVGMYIKYLYDANKSNATIIRSISSIRGFYKFLMDISVLNYNPTSIVDVLKLIESLEADDKENGRVKEKAVKRNTHKSYRAPEGKTPKQIRDKAMIEFMDATKVKATELVNLKLEDADNLSVFEKGLLNEYLKIRSELVGDKNTPYLFVNIDGEKLSRQGLWKILRNYEEK